MKLVHILSLGIFSILLFSCSTAHDSSTDNNRTMIGKVVRDCSGTYIRFAGNKDYFICNSEILKDYADGNGVSVVMEPVEECQEKQELIVCMMYHKNEGMARIEIVK